MRRRADYTHFDYNKNLDIMKELNTQPIMVIHRNDNMFYIQGWY